MAGAKSIMAIAAVAAAPFRANVSLLIFFLLDIVFENAKRLRLEQRREDVAQNLAIVEVTAPCEDLAVIATSRRLQRLP
jgi:hypothetical protein